jgi:drug/metabolite transporter (DMT)-like permease
VRKGVACILASAFGFALMGALVRLSDSFGEPLPTVQKALFRNLVAVIAAGIAFARSGGWGNPELRPTLGKKGKCDLLLRCVFGTCGVFANFYAVSHIPLGDAMALNKTAPVFALMASWVLLGERVSVKQAFCFAGAFAGAILVVKPGVTVFSAASLVGLAGGFCAGTAYAYLHKLGRSGVSGSYIVLMFSAFSSLACVPFVLFSPCAMTTAQIVILCGAGLAAALGQFGITWAYRFAEPRQVAIFDYSGVVFAAVFGFAVFDQVPDLLSFAGFALIAASGAVVRACRR